MDVHSLHLIIVFALVVLVFVAFLREWMSPDLVALSAMGLLLVTGILGTEETLAVFSNSAPIVIGCMFVLSAALERTGAIDALARVFLRMAGKSELRALAALALLTVPLSAFVNNTPVVVVFMPVVLALARTTELKASRLLIPLSYFSILGGTCTLLGTSTNLLVDGVNRHHGQPPFGIFEITPLGIIYAVIGIAYVLLIGRKLLPQRETLAALIGSGMAKQFLMQAIISRESPLVGKTLPETPLVRLREARLIDVVRDGQRLETPLDELRFAAGDILLLESPVAGVKGIKEMPGVVFQPEADLEDAPREAVLMEGIIGSRSGFVGKTLRELNFRQRYGVLILAVHRQGENLREKFEDVRLAFGDTLLVQGPAEGIHRLMQERDFLSLTEPKQRAFRRQKAPLAIAAIVAVMLLAAFNVFSITVLALVAAVLVILTKCLDVDEAYEAIEWPLLFIIFGMLALGQAMETTGAAHLLATGVTGAFGRFGPAVTLSVMYFVAMVLTELISNNAVAVLLTPIAFEIAAAMGVDARPFTIAVMFGCSASFSTPIGYQTNTYVFGAGGYKFTDFPRVGVPLNLILWLTASVLIPIFWPFVAAH
ncbi:MAG: SLC13 family permease [Chthoniobacterales bacterium]|nr:SLC13 family permease [Chthoniobacterales bacterium]